MLTFNLKKEWFEKIKSGEKTHEYREVKPYWDKRIEKEYKNIYEFKPFVFPFSMPNLHHAITICFMCGYPKVDEKDKIIYASLKSVSIINGKNTDLKIDEDVYDIEFELI